MGRLSEDYIKVYAGDQELIDGNAYVGNEPLNTLHRYEHFPFKRWLYDVGDIIVYDKAKNIKRGISVDKLSEISPEDYVPIGVVVIPSSHDVYNTKEAGVISIVNMDSDNPDTGTLDSKPLKCTYPGTFASVYPSGAIDDMVTLGSCESPPELNNTLVTTYGQYVYGLFPTDVDNGYLSDDGLRYPSPAYPQQTYWLPSPFLQNNSKNPIYCGYPRTNVLSDFDGLTNTQNLIPYIRIVDWRTVPSLPSQTTGVATACVWRFHTSGTNQGDWYIPAMGELGYIVCKQGVIQASFDAINSWALETVAITNFNPNGFSSSNGTMPKPVPGYNPSITTWIYEDRVMATDSGNLNPKVVYAFTRVKPSEF